MTPLLCFLLLLFSVNSVISFNIRADVGNSCKKYQRTLQRAEPVLPKMGHRGGEAVDWYFQHWNTNKLSLDDELRRDTIADALRFIFGWQVDRGLGTKTRYYQWVAKMFPAQLRNAGDIRANDIHIECSASFLHETHDGQTSKAADGQKQYWSDLHGGWEVASPETCTGDIEASLLRFQTAPKEVIVICPNRSKRRRMEKELKHLLNWETYMTRGVDYALDLYAGSLSSVLFQELTRTIKGGKTQNREYSTSSGSDKVASDWAGVTQLAVQSADLTFSNAPSVMFFGLVMYLYSIGFVFDFVKGTMQAPEPKSLEGDCVIM